MPTPEIDISLISIIDDKNANDLEDVDTINSITTIIEDIDTDTLLPDMANNQDLVVEEKVPTTMSRTKA